MRQDAVAPLARRLSLLNAELNRPIIVLLHDHTDIGLHSVLCRTHDNGDDAANLDDRQGNDQQVLSHFVSVSPFRPARCTGLGYDGYWRGSPRPRVAMMLRWISLVPAAMVLGTVDM